MKCWHSPFDHYGEVAVIHGEPTSEQQQHSQQWKVAATLDDFDDEAFTEPVNCGFIGFEPAACAVGKLRVRGRGLPQAELLDQGLWKNELAGKACIDPNRELREFTLLVVGQLDIDERSSVRINMSGNHHAPPI